MCHQTITPITAGISHSGTVVFWQPFDFDEIRTIAVEEGSHLFYERQGDGPETLVGRARFSVLWRLEPDGRWRLARAFSIDHAPMSAEAKP